MTEETKNIKIKCEKFFQDPFNKNTIEGNKLLTQLRIIRNKRWHG